MVMVLVVDCKLMKVALVKPATASATHPGMKFERLGAVASFAGLTRSNSLGHDAIYRVIGHDRLGLLARGVNKNRG
jgi:hypothetical protein